MAAASVNIPTDGAGIAELQAFQQHFGDEYRIVVYKYGCKGRDVVFRGERGGKNLDLLHHKGHYNVISSLTAAFSCHYFCEDCSIPFDKKNDHRCAATCVACQRSPPCEKTTERILCDACNREFRGQDCYQHHLDHTVCRRVRRCEKCLATINMERRLSHVCGQSYCARCKEMAPTGKHLCYMKPDTRKPPTESCLLIFFDLETRQEGIGDTKTHVVNLCVSQQCCTACMNLNVRQCEKCGAQQKVFDAEGMIIEMFLKYVLEQRKTWKHIVVLAHNSQAFDCQFLLKHIMEKTDLKPDLIMRGSKIVMMSLGKNLKFIDSLNYFPMALSALPKAFDLPPETKKGYFPHLFNTRENAYYVGTLPPIEFYDPDSMKPTAREEFIKWYEAHKDDRFEMRRDLVDYCVSDVNVLREACVKFRNLFLTACDVCPFVEAVTIASATNLVYRRNFLRPKTIGLIPRNGYRLRDKQSAVAINWMDWISATENIHIRHAGNGREATIHGVKVDGYCDETSQAFEFHGCFYHGCLRCHPSGRNEPLKDDVKDSFAVRYERTLKKTSRLRGLGVDVVEVWECDFKRERREQVELKQFLATLNHSEPLDPRDAFFGGRTGNTRKHYECGPEEKIRYVDVCSLYPWCCKYGKFPVGHPKIIIGQELRNADLWSLDGIVKCKVLPPTSLYHPVLPIKQNAKLMFSLCRSCSGNMSQEDCSHTDEERAITGTWVVDEVKKAMEMGYQILEVYEFWHYQVERYDPDTKQGGLFTDLMNKFIKIKQEASGWPAGCVTEEQRQRYVGEYLRNEGVALEPLNIAKNAGLRSLAKLILNSFWGKFGQRENQPKVSILADSAEFHAMFADPNIYVNYINEVNEDHMLVNWEHREECTESLTTVNVAIAAYTTAQARLRLYTYLEMLGERVLYYDTDSCIYVSKDGEVEVPTGSFLGQMTDELEEYGAGSYIREFCSAGPKNYAYLVHTPGKQEPSVVCKVKGIRLTYAATQHVNMQAMRDLILDSAAPIYVRSRQFRRTQDINVVTCTESKVFRVCATKRRFLPDHSSVPYGFKRPRLE